MTEGHGRTRWWTRRYGRGRGCEGQTAVEYVGIGAVVLALILAMLMAGRASGVGVAIGGRLCRAVATIGAGDAADCATSGTGDGTSGGEGGDGSSANDVGSADAPTLTDRAVRIAERFHLDAPAWYRRPASPPRTSGDQRPIRRHGRGHAPRRHRAR
ncbi:hypothetical protein ABWK57_30870 [Streptomyces sp. NPDC094045]|uniref:hypothetical protein n=1 Tax=Streptomyces sp. NPDC094045 TaxID=3161019 RepID=UPI0033912904